MPVGFSATILATDLGATRHIAVGKNGDMYVKLSKLKENQEGIYVLQDTDGDGAIDQQKVVRRLSGYGHCH